MKKNRILVYTDGSTYENPGVGGFAYVALNWNKSEIIRKYSKFLDITTNNQAELLAIIYSVEWFLDNYSEGKELIIFSDSEISVKGASEWMYRWDKENWIKKNPVTGKCYPRPNKKLWIRLYESVIKNKDRIHFNWIRGHNGDTYNELADKLSYDAWKKLLT